MILDGKKVSEKILNDVKQKVSKMERKPHLVVILVGDDAASRIYVNNKKIAAEKVGIKSTILEFESTISEASLISKIEELNNDTDVTGILVQLPLPEHIDKNKIVTAICPKKDVDGFTPVNVGRMLIGDSCFLPCTPHGIIKLIEVSGMDIREEQHICLAGTWSVLSAFFNCGFIIKCDIERQRSVNDRISELTGFTGLAQFFRIDRYLHLRINNFNCRKRKNKK